MDTKNSYIKGDMQVNKRILLFLFLVICFLLSACTEENDFDCFSIQTLHEREYDCVSVNEVSDFWVNDVNLATASIEEISDNNLQIADNNAPLVETAKEAAIYGATQLDYLYDSWTFDCGVVVFFNDNANVWVVHGQVEDRYSTYDIGFIVLEKGTGSIISYGKK